MTVRLWGRFEPQYIEGARPAGDRDSVSGGKRHPLLTVYRMGKSALVVFVLFSWEYSL